MGQADRIAVGQHRVVGEGDGIGTDVVQVNGVRRAVRIGGEQILAPGQAGHLPGLDLADQPGHHLPGGHHMDGADTLPRHGRAQEVALPVPGQVGVDPVEPAFRIIKWMPGFIKIDPHAGGRGAGAGGPAGKVFRAVVISDRVADLDHLGQHHRPVVAAVQRRIGGTELRAPVLVGQARNIARSNAASARRPSPAGWHGHAPPTAPALPACRDRRGCARGGTPAAGIRERQGHGIARREFRRAQGRGAAPACHPGDGQGRRQSPEGQCPPQSPPHRLPFHLARISMPDERSRRQPACSPCRPAGNLVSL